MTAGRTRVVIDCDPGVDDAVMLGLAIASPELDVQGVMTVAGNATAEVTTANARALLGMWGRTDIPVAAGAQRPLVHAYEHGQPPPHGPNGLGGVELPNDTAPLEPRHAVDLLRDVLLDGPATLVATAPLTNIALFLCRYPELAGRIDHVVIMGGSAGPGNITPTAEFNTWTDPEAAQRVLTEPRLSITLIGLDVTREARLTLADVDRISHASASGRRLAEMIHGYQDVDADGWAVHDAVTVAGLLDPNVLRTESALVEVDTSTGLGRGQTVIEFRLPQHARIVGRSRYSSAGQVRVATGLNRAQFRELVVSRLARLA